MPKEKTLAEQRLENEGGPPLNMGLKSDRMGVVIQEIDPTKDGRYRLDLRKIAKEKAPKLGRTYVCTNYVIDENGGIAVKGIDGPPKAIQNDPDWSEFQLIQSQVDIIITSTSYFHRIKNLGKDAQNVLGQFGPGAPFSQLGDWREKMELKRSPDVAVLSGTLDFDFPDFLTEEPRKLIVYTTSENLDEIGTEKFKKAQEFKKRGAILVVVESLNKDGKLRVDGKKLVKDTYERGYILGKNTAGPSILNTLLEANVLDLLFVTLVHRKLDVDPEKLIKIPINMANKDKGFDGFTLLKGYDPEVAIARDGQPINQEFLVYENKTASHG